MFAHVTEKFFVFNGNHGMSCNYTHYFIFLVTILYIFKWSIEQFHIHEKLSLCMEGHINRSYSMFPLHFFLVSLVFMNMQMRFDLNI